MATEWFHKTGDDVRGPMPFSDLVEAARAGRVARSDFVRSSWHEDWQPAGAVLEKHLAGDPQEPENSEWSETVKAAVAASKARHAAHVEPEAEPDSERKFGNPLHGLSGLTGALLAPLAWIGRRLLGAFEGTFSGLGDLGGGPTTWFAIGIPAVFALAAAGMAGLAIEDWSASDALLRSVNASPRSRLVQSIGRRIPLFGPSNRGEYLFFLVDIMLVVAGVTFFLVRLLLFAERPGTGTDAGGARDTGAVRQLLGGRVFGACLLFGMAAVLLKDSSVFAPSYQRIYGAARSAIERVKDMSHREPKPEEWDALEAEVGADLLPAVDGLIKRASRIDSVSPASQEYHVNYHIWRPLIQIGRYQVPALIRASRSGKVRDDKIESLERDLDAVGRSLEVMSLWPKTGT